MISQWRKSFESCAQLKGTFSTGTGRGTERNWLERSSPLDPETPSGLRENKYHQSDQCMTNTAPERKKCGEGGCRSSGRRSRNFRQDLAVRECGSGEWRMEGKTG